MASKLRNTAFRFGGHILTRSLQSRGLPLEAHRLNRTNLRSGKHKVCLQPDRLHSANLDWKEIVGRGTYSNLGPHIWDHLRDYRFHGATWG